MRILLLGGGGFIGSHLTHRMLQDDSHQLTVFDRSAEKLVEVQHHPRLAIVTGDLIDDTRSIDGMVHDHDVTVNLIAHCNPSLYVQEPLEIVTLNLDENRKVAEMCVRHQKRLVQFSSCEVYGKTVAAIAGDQLTDPEASRHAVFREESSPMIVGPIHQQRWIYSNAKQLLERILHAYGLAGHLDYSIIRPFNFIGPRIDYVPSDGDANPRVFSQFVRALKTGSPLRLVDGGQQRRCYTYILDGVEATARVIENRDGCASCQIFNVGNPNNELTIRSLAEKMLDTYRRLWWDGQTPLSDLVDISGEEFYGVGYDDCDRRIPDIIKAKQLLGWDPEYDVDSLIQQSMEYEFGAHG